MVFRELEARVQPLDAMLEPHNGMQLVCVVNQFPHSTPGIIDMPTAQYSYLVEIDEGSRTLSIYRISDDGKRQFYTSVKLPTSSYTESPERYQEFFKLFGENLILDSPQGRRCLGIDESMQ